MNARTREGFYTLWTIAILLCLGACVFLLGYVSIKDAGESADTAAPPGTGTVVSPAPASDGSTVPADGQQAPADGSTVPADGQQAPADGGTVPADGQQAPTEDQAAAPAAPQAPPSTVLAETLDLGQEYQDKLVFLGDSTTYGLYAYGVLPHWQVLVPSNGTLSLFNWAVESVECYAPGDDQNAQNLSIADAVASRQPEYLIITLGINGVSILNEEQFKEYYLGLVQAIQTASPNTRIICNSIYPVIDANTAADIKNDKINAANQWILDVATQTGTRFLNSREALADGTGNLSTQFVDAQNDGIHMNASGYSALLQYVRSHGYQ